MTFWPGLPFPIFSAGAIPESPDTRMRVSGLRIDSWLPAFKPRATHEV